MSFSSYLLSEVKVSFHQDFEVDFDTLNEAVQDELLAHAKLLEQFGPQLGQPRVDTLNGARHANLKELRLKPMMAPRAEPSPSTQSDKPCCLWWATSPAVVRSIVPTTRINYYKEGRRVSSERNREKKWADTWYLHPKTVDKKTAWGGALEFIGEMDETE
jgi:Phage derived protein Gp49-like (DUF891)